MARRRHCEIQVTHLNLVPAGQDLHLNLGAGRTNVPEGIEATLAQESWLRKVEMEGEELVVSGRRGETPRGRTESLIGFVSLLERKDTDPQARDHRKGFERDRSKNQRNHHGGAGRLIDAFCASTLDCGRPRGSEVTSTGGTSRKMVSILSR